MESIYYVLAWHCHRRCRHCYEERFRPYRRDELAAVVTEARSAMPRIVDHFPDRMTFLDRDVPDASPEKFARKQGRIILSGGEVLTDPIREAVLYPAIERIAARYRDVGGVKILVQTTGDLVTEEIVDDLLRRGVWMISVSGMDDFHVGMEGERRVPLIEHLTRIFEAAGMRPSGHRPGTKWSDEDGPVFSFFGATEDHWIGRIWPRGRAWSNGLSRATIDDNFCDAWSGGRDFLRYGWSGSEVSVEPSGDVYPCCMKSGAPIGNLVEEPLLDILRSLSGHPAFEAISEGRPERMGLDYGWTSETFLERSRTVTPQGKPYANLCVGCDRFHDEVLGPVIAALREDRRLRRASGALEG